MQSSPASSNASSGCRIDWCPSRWLALALIALGAMAAASVWLSAIPDGIRLPAAMLALLQGLRLAGRERTRPRWVLAWDGGDAPVHLVGTQGRVALSQVRVSFRGPMATLAGTDEHGSLRRLVWWPDTLPPGPRRQLRLAAAVSRRSNNPPPQLAA